MEACRALRRWSPATSVGFLTVGAGRLRSSRAMITDFEPWKPKTAYEGLLLDAGGTLLQLARPVEETYASIGSKYGLNASVDEIKRGFRRAFSAPWPKKLRYQGDGREFWRLVVSEATGCTDNDYFEEVYEVRFYLSLFNG